MKSCLAPILLMTAACGGDLDPGAGDDPGTGTQTLVVDGSVRATNRLANARSYGEFDTDISVRVTLNGQSVTTGTVTITSASGTVPLVFDPSPDNGRWEGQLPGYDEVFVLDVQAGPDEVIGVRVDGPDRFVFTSPSPGASVDSRMPLAVGWECEDTAESASIRAGEIESVAIDDTGEFSLPPGSLKAEKDRARENGLRITRTNRVTPAGAAAGSEFTVSVTNEISVLALPDPSL